MAGAALSERAALMAVFRAALLYVRNRQEINRTSYSRENDMAAHCRAADKSGQCYAALENAVEAALPLSAYPEVVEEF